MSMYFCGMPWNEATIRSRLERQVSPMMRLISRPPGRLDIGGIVIIRRRHTDKVGLRPHPGEHAKHLVAHRGRWVAAEYCG